MLSLADCIPSFSTPACAWVVASVLIATGCTTTRKDPSNTDGYSSAQPTQAPQSVQARPAMENPEHTTMYAPLSVSIQKGQETPSTGETEFLIQIDVPAPISYPVTLMAMPPRSGALVLGTPRETLNLNQAGHVTKTYRVKTPNPITNQDPFRIVLHGETADGSMGLHADKQFPPAPELVMPSRTNPAGAPGGRPPSPAPRTISTSGSAIPPPATH